MISIVRRRKQLVQFKNHENCIILSTGFVHLHNLRNPGFSRAFFTLLPGVFLGYLKYTKQHFPGFSRAFQDRDRGRSVIEGAHIHIFGFINRENNQFKKKLYNEAESEHMNMAPLNYRSSTVPAGLK